MGGARYDDVEDTQFPTHIIISADVFSRYVFRSDVAYDWDVRLEDLMLDTILYKDKMTTFIYSPENTQDYGSAPIRKSQRRMTLRQWLSIKERKAR